MNKIPTAINNQRAARACSTLRAFVSSLLIGCAFLQLFIDSSLTNFYCVFIATIGSIATFSTVSRAAQFQRAVLPSLVVLGFNIASMSGALITQTASFKSLIYNLKEPGFTFTMTLAFQISLIISLFIFARTKILYTISNAIAKRYLKKIGVFNEPKDIQLWIMGFLGTIALTFNFGSSPSAVEFGDTGSKLLEGFRYLAYAPLLIPIKRFIFQNSIIVKSNGWKVFFYCIVLILIGIARNSRGTFAMGIAGLGFSVFALYLLGRIQITRRIKIWVLIFIATAGFIAPLASDLATAMAVVRSEKSETSNIDLVKKTIDAYQDKKKLEAYRTLGFILSGYGEYNELYSNNPFLARFIHTKFLDNTLSLKGIDDGTNASEMWRITIDKTFAFLPTPILNFLNIGIDKNDLAFSMGDALYSLSNNGTGLGGFRTGSTVAHGLSLLSYAFFPVSVIFFVVIFIGIQSMSLKTTDTLLISPIILLQFMKLYYLAVGDSLLEPIGMLIRTLPQEIIIYAVLFKLTKIFSTTK